MKPAKIVASCHCGDVRLEIARRPRSVTECTCRICRRYAARWAYYRGDAVRVIAARGALARYTGRVKTFVYHHCRRCGCVTHYRRRGTVDDTRIAVNARMFHPADLAGVRVRVLKVRP